MNHCADCGKRSESVAWSSRFLSHLCDDCYQDALHEISTPKHWWDPNPEGY